MYLFVYIHGRSKKPAHFCRLAACPPMLRWTWSSPSIAEDKVRLQKVFQTFMCDYKTKFAAAM